ncbi:disulfide bond formation protein B [Rhizobium lusitanum]|uniref:Disulfide bond formation protein DsbB n=1 Tax=Rhizobium lusitanum TaxID=293958 RepID=A0A7X0MGS6_9HYPH|nr:disulfide bond formation protein B [Rhizobium lusitanum]MBB6488393.1 disulfide bond formation protein DsbB [Rhizobium lusitanum]
MSTTSTSSRAGLGYSTLLTIGMIVVIGSALAFQYKGGYIPCALCLEQRQPYYYGIPVAIVAALSAIAGLPSWITRGLLIIAGLMMVVGGGIGVYHAGVEWHFWEGPTTCSTTASSMTQNAGNLLSELSTIKGPSCTEAALRVLGLSMAGWNVIASVILAAIAFVGAKKAA